jgi:hypothetical protein
MDGHFSYPKCPFFSSGGVTRRRFHRARKIAFARGKSRFGVTCHFYDNTFIMPAIRRGAPPIV